MAEEPAGNEFVIFSKPELGRLSAEDTDKVWDLFSSALGSYGVTVHRTRILTGPELESTGVMAEHYGVINKISRLGRPPSPRPPSRPSVEQYADALEAGALVLGGHQFLSDYPELRPVLPRRAVRQPLGRPARVRARTPGW